MPVFKAFFAIAKKRRNAALIYLGVYAVITLLLAEVVLPALPYLRAFAAGAMIYVVVEELIPEMSQGEKGHSNIGTVSFALGFTIMMALDLALG